MLGDDDGPALSMVARRAVKSGGGFGRFGFWVLARGWISVNACECET
jgi:hypothetical protein